MRVELPTVQPSADFIEIAREPGHVECEPDMLDFWKWVRECPAEMLLSQFKEQGFRQGLRFGKDYPEEKDEFGRIRTHRIRVVVEVSPATYAEMRDDVPQCDCEKAQWTGVYIPNNPDIEYCGYCKGTYNRHYKPICNVANSIETETKQTTE